MTNSQLFALSDLTDVSPISGWQDFLHDGQGFLATASAAISLKRKTFTAEILYNLIAMAIEKFVMAALMRHGTMPYNHTMKDMVEAMDETFPAAINDFRDDLLKMDSYQEICDLDGFKITPPEMSKITGMLTIANKLEVLVTHKLAPTQ